MENNGGMLEEQHLNFDKDLTKTSPFFWPQVLIMNSQSGANLGAVYSPLKVVVLFWKC